LNNDKAHKNNGRVHGPVRAMPLTRCLKTQFEN